MTTTAPGFKTTHEVDMDSSRYQQVLAAIRQWDKINDGHHAEKRPGERLNFNGNPILVVTLPATAGDELHAEPQSISFSVSGRNISRSGMSFLASRVIMPVLASDETPIVQLEDVLIVPSELTVGLPEHGSDGLHWLVAKLVRLRRVHEELLEGGVQFLRKQDSAPAKLQTTNASV
jgi:hypothetical protein